MGSIWMYTWYVRTSISSHHRSPFDPKELSNATISPFLYPRAIWGGCLCEGWSSGVASNSRLPSKFLGFSVANGSDPDGSVILLVAAARSGIGGTYLFGSGSSHRYVGANSYSNSIFSACRKTTPIWLTITMRSYIWTGRFIYAAVKLSLWSGMYCSQQGLIHAQQSSVTFSLSFVVTIGLKFWRSFWHWIGARLYLFKVGVVENPRRYAAVSRSLTRV